MDDSATENYPTMIANFLQKSFALPNLSDIPQFCDAHCAITGEHVTQGYPIKQIVRKAMGDVADIIGIGEWLSVEAAQCLKASKILRGNLLGLPDKGIHPFISQESATAERPCWRELLMSLSLGIQTVAIFSDESKRRLWPFARLSFFGENWQPLLNANGICRNLMINVSILREYLTSVEEIYTIGFSKQSIKQSLLDSVNSKWIHAIGIRQTILYENTLSAWRGSDEFLLAVFVAQKRPDMVKQEQKKKQCKQLILL